MSDILKNNIPTTEELLMMFIKVGYSQTGKVNKSTALAMMRYVNNDKELQNKVNQGNNAAILKHKPKSENQETIAKQAERIKELEKVLNQLVFIDGSGNWCVGLNGDSEVNYIIGNLLQKDGE